MGKDELDDFVGKKVTFSDEKKFKMGAVERYASHELHVGTKERVFSYTPAEGGVLMV